jgi:uncharacterized repeat protein (TIGR03803 family)
MRAKAVVVLTFLLFSITSSQAAKQKVLYSFKGSPDGSGPYAGVIFDKAGNLYGVTQMGGIYGLGTVYQLTPSSAGIWTETVLYNFTGGTDGYEPIGGLAIDAVGNLYGTAAGGGDFSDCGTVFKLSPSGSTWTFTVLHSFTDGRDGCTPESNLRYGGGVLSGTTVNGGPSQQGTAFTLSASGGYDFVAPFSRNKGNQPWGGVNAWGYGTTYAGGPKGGGTVYSWPFARQLIVKHAFGSLDKAGYHPLGDLLTGSVNGGPAMFGTTFSRGTVYLLTPGNKIDAWHLTVLYSFTGNANGTSPGAGLVLDPAGNLYGTTIWGGTDAGLAGTVFKLTPGAKNQWTHTLLYSFTGGTDGGDIYSGVVLDNAGNLYGTALIGGTSGWGVVYEVTP